MKYLTVLDAMGYDTGPYTWAITPTQRANGHIIWVFKVTPGPIAGVHSKQLNGPIHLWMMFSPQLPANATLIVLSEEPATVEIDQVNHVQICDRTLIRIELFPALTVTLSDNPSLSYLIFSSDIINIMTGEAIDSIRTEILWASATHNLDVFSPAELPHLFSRITTAYVANTDPSSLNREHRIAFYHLSPLI